MLLPGARPRRRAWGARSPEASSAGVPGMSVDIEEAVNPLAPTPGRDATTIDVGPGLLYIAPLGTAEPPDPTDASWPAAWIELGYTDDGSEFKVEPTVDDINV